jgi:hypothetical protein
MDQIQTQPGTDLMVGEEAMVVAMEKEVAVETDEEAGKVQSEGLVVLEVLEEMDGRDQITIQLGMGLVAAEEAMVVAMEKEVAMEEEGAVATDEEEGKVP